MATLTEPLAFAPTSALLAAALAEIDDLGDASGSAFDAAARAAALQAFSAFRGRRPSRSKRWRHDYGALGYADLLWTTGRMRVPAAPGRAIHRAHDADGAADLPALAAENAGGIVHAGSIYLQPAHASADPRVTVTALADALRTGTAGRQRGPACVLGALARPRDDRFVALATAFQNCGAYVEVAPETHLEQPLQIVWSARPGPPSAVFARTVVRVGAGAQVTIVERHLGESESFVANVVEIELEARARLDYVVVQQADDGARVMTYRTARCGPDATIGWHVADLGGALVRSLVRTTLATPRAAVEVNAFTFAAGFGNVDLSVLNAHEGPQQRSQAVIRAAALDRSAVRFTGSLRAEPAAAGTIAAMRYDALALSRDVALEAKPKLSAGGAGIATANLASVGSLDAEAVFYIQTRGIPRRSAERMVALAFFEPAIRNFPSEALRDELRTALDERLDAVPETFAQ